MIVIKKYANGRLYDSENKKYVTLKQLANMVKKKKKFKVILAKDKKDITKKVVSNIPKGPKAKKEALIKTDNLKKWVNETIDKRVDKILSVMNLPTKKQVTALKSGIDQIGRKIEKLEKLQAKKIKDMEKSQTKKIDKLEESYKKKLDSVATAVKDQPTAPGPVTTD